MDKSKGQKPASSPLESPEALSEKLIGSEEFLQKYRNIILGGLVVVLLVVGGLVFNNIRLERLDAEAQSAMFPAVYYAEADSLNKALEGDLGNKGMLDIIKDYDGTKAANLAKFYAGNAYLKQGEFEEAIKYFKDFSSDDLLLQARVYSLIGDAYIETDNFDKAVEYYNKAVNYKPNPHFTPQYMMKAALAYELKNDHRSAADMYERLISLYPKAQQVNEAKKYKSRVVAILERN